MQWRDPTGTGIATHVLTAPKKLTIDSATGFLTVAPAARFDGFREKLDKVELQPDGKNCRFPLAVLYG